MTETAAPRPVELRRQVRRWRRGRAELNYWDVFNDAYIALFATVMVGSMAATVVLDLTRQANASCGGGCGQVRATSPWMCALALGAFVLGVSRLLGPVFSPPAANAWLLSTPVDRGGLLRPGWWRTVLITSIGAAVTLLAVVTLAGYTLVESAAFVVGGTAASVACAAAAALSQVHQHGAARRLTWLVAVSLWAVLAAAAIGRLEVAPPVGVRVGIGLATLCVLAAAALTWRSVRSLPRTSRRVLGQTEHLSASLSGALASLDLGLMYDVLLARRWGKNARVRPWTGGPLGWWALLHRDAYRVVRTPQPYVVLAGMVLLPYAAAAADAGRATVLVTTAAGLVAGPPLCAGLRVVVRTSSIIRMLPMSGRAVRSAHAITPCLALTVFSLATTGALLASLPLLDALAAALGCGLSASAATIRWITAKPADYSRPMVSTPAGAVPPGAIISVLRGLDIWLLTALPLAIGGWGVPISIALSLTVIYVLISEDRH